MIAPVALAVGEGLWGENVGKFEGISEGALYEGGEEGGGVVADGEGAAVVWVAAGFGDGDAGG